MQIDTEIKATIRTTLGDSFEDDISKEEIDNAVEEHIKDFCKCKNCGKEYNIFRGGKK